QRFTPSRPAPAHDELVRRLGLAGPAFLLAPRAGRVPASAGLPLAPTQWVVDGVHGHAANRGADPAPPVAAGLAPGYKLVFGVPHLAHRGSALRGHQPDLTGG